jgi:AraC-like DNA-binding protein
VLAASPLSRPTLYRLFEAEAEAEGGLAAYIRNRRLREAADELHRYPRKAIVEIAYGTGFNSASDFNRAFRRAYDMSPSDFRALTRLSRERCASKRGCSRIPFAWPWLPDSHIALSEPGVRSMTSGLRTVSAQLSLSCRTVTLASHASAHGVRASPQP